MRGRRVLVQKLNSDPTDAELAKESGFPEQRVRQLLALVEDPVSLQTPVGDGEGIYADLIEDPNSERPDETTSKQLCRVEVAEAVLRLKPRLRHVLSLRFGLNDTVPQTLEEVGGGLGITRERVRQLESRVRKLRTVAPNLELHLHT
jgi:RNA polymerase primary sigma factor